MTISTIQNGMVITYSCYKLPGHGDKCPDKNTYRCYTCKYCKAQISARDMTRLLRGYQRKYNNTVTKKNENI